MKTRIGIVGAGGVADRIHLLRLAKLRLEPFPFRHVNGVHDYIVRLDKDIGDVQIKRVPCLRHLHRHLSANRCSSLETAFDIASHREIFILVEFERSLPDEVFYFSFGPLECRLIVGHQHKTLNLALPRISRDRDSSILGVQAFLALQQRPVR